MKIGRPVREVLFFHFDKHKLSGDLNRDAMAGENGRRVPSKGVFYRAGGDHNFTFCDHFQQQVSGPINPDIDAVCQLPG
jgi:hypothetical protein